MPGDEHRPALNPAALSVADAAKLLSKIGGKPVTQVMLADDLLAGAPTNADGTINLVRYAAWLLSQMSRSAGERDGE